MKLYMGGPSQPPCVGENNRKRRLPQATDEDGKPLNFSWGDGSIDSARLAFAILRDALGNDHEAWRYYMLFKVDPVQLWKAGEPWAISEDAVLQRVKRIREVLDDAAKMRAIVDREARPVDVEAGGGVGRSRQ